MRDNRYFQFALRVQNQQPNYTDSDSDFCTETGVRHSSFDPEIESRRTAKSRNSKEKLATEPQRAQRTPRNSCFQHSELSVSSVSSVALLFWFGFMALQSA